MPEYVYKCKKCGKELEEYHSVKDRYNQLCPDCKGEVEIVIQPIVSHIFQAFFHPNLDSKPVWIKSKKHLKEESDKRNFTSYY